MELARWFAIYRLSTNYLYADRYKTRSSRRATPIKLYLQTRPRGDSERLARRRPRHHAQGEVLSHAIAVYQGSGSYPDRFRTIVFCSALEPGIVGTGSRLGGKRREMVPPRPRRLHRGAVGSQIPLCTGRRTRYNLLSEALSRGAMFALGVDGVELAARLPTEAPASGVRIDTA